MIRTSAALLLIALLLAGCGANGAPEPPEGYQPRPDKPFVLDPMVKSPVSSSTTSKPAQRR